MDTDFKIGDWHVEPGHSRIRRNSEIRQVEPKVMDVLVALRNAEGRTVSAEALIDQVWPDTHVSETLIRRAISELRKVLDDNAKDPKYVETIPKLGYRLKAAVYVLPKGGNEEHEAVIRALTGHQLEPVKPHRDRRWFYVGIMLLSAWTIYLILNRAVSPEQERFEAKLFEGETTRVLTEIKGLESYPVLSPGGDKVAFVYHGGRHGTGQIFIRYLEGNNAHKATSEDMDARSPSWSPFGDELMFAARWNGLSRILKVHSGAFSDVAQTTSDRNVLFVTGSEIDSLDWSPRGGVVVFSEREEGLPYRLNLLNPLSGEDISFTEPPKPYLGDRQPKFSPDGNSVAFVRSIAQGQEDIFLINTSGGAVTRLTRLNQDIGGISWAADGKAIVFAIRHFGRYQLWQQPVSGGQPSLFLNAPNENLRHPCLSRDGHSLVCQRLDIQTEIFRYDLNREDARLRVFVSASHWDTAPQYSPDGKQIAFMSTRAGPTEIFMVSAEGNDLVPLTSFGGPFTSNPAWAPDGKRIALESRVNGHGDIFLIHTQSGERQRRITHSPAEERFPVWSHDGKFIYFTSDRADGWQIWKASSEGSGAVRVTKYGGFLAEESPDGEWLYYSKHQIDGLWRIPIDGGEEQKVIPLSHKQWGNWALSDDGVYYVEDEKEEQPYIAFFQLGKGQASKIVTLTDVPENPSLTLSPDGQWLLFSRLDKYEGNLVIFQGKTPKEDH